MTRRINDKKLQQLPPLGSGSDAMLFYTEVGGVAYRVTGANAKAYFSSGSGNDKGYFATEAALVAAYPSGTEGWFAIVGSTATFWIWNGTEWDDTGDNATIVGLANNTEFDADNNAKAATPEQINTRGENTIKIAPTAPADAPGLTLTSGKATIRVFADWVIDRLKTIFATVTSLTTTVSGKVTGNAAITGATRTKITYDSKGLVTSGADLADTDIPALPQSKITDLTTDLAAKALDSAVVHTTGNETKAGVLTLTSPPVLPAETSFTTPDGSGVFGSSLGVESTATERTKTIIQAGDDSLFLSVIDEDTDGSTISNSIGVVPTLSNTSFVSACISPSCTYRLSILPSTIMLP